MKDYLWISVKQWRNKVMTQENKIQVILSEDMQLLFNDIQARIPYGVLVTVRTAVYEVLDAESPWLTVCSLRWNSPQLRDVCTVKPYLFPMSSITEEQKEEIKFDTSSESIEDWTKRLIVFYLKHHIDYNGLIEKGLAIDATGKGIY